MYQICTVVLLTTLMLWIVEPSGAERKYYFDHQHFFEIQLTNREDRQLSELRDTFVRRMGDNCRMVYNPAEGVRNYVELVKASHKLDRCFEILETVNQTRLRYKSPRAPQELYEVFDDYCQQAIPSERCIVAFAKRLQYCLDDPDRDYNNSTLNIYMHTLNYICTAGDHSLQLFPNEAGPACMEQRKSSLTGCTREAFRAFEPNFGRAANIRDLNQLLAMPTPCIDLEVFRQCILNTLIPCNSIIEPGRIEELFITLRSIANCKGGEHKTLTELLPRQVSGASHACTTLVLPLLFVRLAASLAVH